MAQPDSENGITDFLVSRADLRETKLVAASQPPPPSDGQVLMKIDSFGLSANNITYAVFGDAMSYWDFFPTDPGWGRVPVWGFAEIVASKAEGLAVGERIYGYFPMSAWLTVDAAKLTAHSFFDQAVHRRNLSPVYNQYRRVAADPGYNPDREEMQMLFQPLFITSFLIEDFIQDNDLFGADAVVLSSASSKTAIALAWCLANNREHSPRVIGLTSPHNMEFVSSLGIYTDIVSYDDLARLSPTLKTVFVDMAGNGQLLHDVHHHFGENLTYSCMVGGTHWENRQTQHELPGAKPVFFFAPDQIKKRTGDWGPGGLQQRLAGSWLPFVEFASGWIKLKQQDGWQAVQAAYLEMLEGNSDPKSGYILTLP